MMEAGVSSLQQFSKCAFLEMCVGAEKRMYAELFGLSFCKMQLEVLHSGNSLIAAFIYVYCTSIVLLSAHLTQVREKKQLRHTCPTE